MSIKFEKIKPGMTLYDTMRQRMGNTAMSHTVVVEYRVKAVDAELRQVALIRNGRVFTYGERQVCSLRASNPTCPECKKVAKHAWECSRARKNQRAP